MCRLIAPVTQRSEVKLQLGHGRGDQTGGAAGAALLERLHCWDQSALSAACWAAAAKDGRRAACILKVYALQRGSCTWDETMLAERKRATTTLEGGIG